jgi:hypothetical protein
MPAVGNTSAFPRADNLYKAKESIPFDECQSKVWRDRPTNETKEAIKEWGAYAMIGLLIGITAFLMKLLEEWLLEMGVHAA